VAVPQFSPCRVDRASLARCTIELLNRGGRRNPDVLLVEQDGHRWVVKDFSPRGLVMRRWIGPFLLRREARAFQALADHPAVPAFAGWIDDRAIALEYRPGVQMSRQLRGVVPPGFVSELEQAIERMHAAGVVHLDLRHRSNVLMDEEGRPVLIDFGSALRFGPRSLGRRLLLPWLARIDRSALEKWRVRVDPDQEGAGGSSSGSGRNMSRPT